MFVPVSNSHPITCDGFKKGGNAFSAVVRSERGSRRNENQSGEVLHAYRGTEQADLVFGVKARYYKEKNSERLQII